MMYNVFKILCLPMLLLSFINASHAELIENQDYKMLSAKVGGTVIPNEKIEVIEFFSYGCPYCHMLEPQIAAWLADKPANVDFKRIAIPRKGRWNEYARLFYALEMISPAEQERITPIMYTAIHEQKHDFSSEEALFSWAQQHDIDRKKLETFYYSQAVSDKINKGLALAQAYDVKYVPSIYVNHQYQLVLDSKNEYKNTKNKLNELIEHIEANK